MTELQGLIETDRLATLSVNGSDSLFSHSLDSTCCICYIAVNQEYKC